MSDVRILATASVCALAISLTGCAGSPPSTKSAEQACNDTVDGSANPAACDDYVAAAKRSGDNRDLFEAYSIRSVLWQAKGDLKAAIRDADLAIEARPELDYGHGWRAVLLGESGEYASALKELKVLERNGALPEFHADMAMLEYVTGDVAASAALFRSASQYFSEVDRNEVLAAENRFNAAIVESELKGGDLAPIRAVQVTRETNALVALLQEYRTTDMPDSHARLFIQMADAKGRAAACETYFSIGHKNALAGDIAAAKPAFESALDRCQVHEFELHAAKKWLKTLGS